MENNMVETALRADLKFTYPIDMTEFNQRTLKVNEIDKAREEYLREKSPAKEKVIEIFNRLEKELSELGYTCVKNITNAYENTEQCMVRDALETILTGIPILPSPEQK